MIQEIQYILLDSPWSITPSPANPHKTRLKSDSEKGYFIFDLFFFLKAKLIINRIIHKEIAFFRIGFKACFVGIGWGWSSKWWRFYLCLTDLLDLGGKVQNSIFFTKRVKWSKSIVLNKIIFSILPFYYKKFVLKPLNQSLLKHGDKL